jgi:hypothetical protein
MRSPEAILDLYRNRRLEYADLHGKMQTIADIYNGRAVVPLPDMERNEQPSIPNLLQQGVDQMAGRITSVVPAVSFSSARPGFRKADRTAQAASQAVTGWWQMDRLPQKMKARGRRLIAYGMAPVVMRWDYEKHCPTWQVRHPLDTFPSLDLEPGQVRPQDCLFTMRRTVGWMKEQGYGGYINALTGRIDTTNDTIITLIEYIDKDHTTLLATGYFNGYGGYTDQSTNAAMRAVVLESFETLTDETPVIIPTRLTLDQMTGQFDGMIGMFYQQAKLMALESIAVEKGIFPDTYLVSRPGEVGRVVDGPHDGRTGRINLITGGDIKELQTSPGYMTQQTIDRLERAQRVTSGIPAEFGGESGSNIRTGRRGDAVLSATIDYPVAEAQEAFAFALEVENEAAMQYAKRIDGDTKRTIYVGTGNARKPVTYVASETFEVEQHVVSYPATGSDMNSLIIGLGQRVGLGTMSKYTAAVMDPYIENPEAEHDQIIAEGLEQALMAGIQQQASTGAIPPLVLSKVMTLVRNDKLELAEALTKVTEDAAAAEAEAAAGAEQGMAMSADQAMAPAAQASLAGPPSVAPVSESQQNLSTLLATLRRPAQTIQPMRGAARGAV